MIGITMLAFLTAFWVIAIIFWLAMVKKRLLDPRNYVLYGLFHWLIVGQLGTLLGYNFYEVKPFFDDVVHVKAAILIACSVLAFLAGYDILPRPSVNRATLVNPSFSVLATRERPSEPRIYSLVMSGVVLGLDGHIVVNMRGGHFLDE